MKTSNTYTVFAQEPKKPWKAIGDDSATSRAHAISIVKAGQSFPRGTKFKAEKWLDDRGFKRNPAIKLPSHFTPAEVRVNEEGKVQIRINPAKLGSGGRFARCVESVEAKGGAADPRAVCAAAEMKKYGKRKFQAMAQAGRKRNPSSPRNGYVVYPGSIGYMSLRSANQEAKEQSLEYGEARVERTDNNKTVATWKNGLKTSGNPSKRSVLKRVRKALTKYVRSQPNPNGLKHWTVKVPKTPYDSGYNLSIKGKTKRSALNQALEYCSARWAKYTGKPKSQYRLPRGTKATEAR